MAPRLGELEQPFPEIAAALRIDRAGRFVEQQELGRVQRGGGQRQALLLPAAHGAGALRAQLLEIVGGALFGDARLHVTFEPVQIGHEAQVLVGGEVFPQREFLRHVAEPAPDGLGVFHDGESEHFGVAVARQQHAAEHAQRGGFAGAVGPEESVDASRRDVEVDVIHRDLVAEFSRELPRGDRRWAPHVHGDCQRQRDVRPARRKAATTRRHRRSPLRQGTRDASDPRRSASSKA